MYFVLFNQILNDKKPHTPTLRLWMIRPLSKVPNLQTSRHTENDLLNKNYADPFTNFHHLLAADRGS